uniref:Uncharacterized protein n=1 Tax=viral metagenome TaxID=1070528 RepID=A0A6C0C9R2_9ZZZZ
MEMSVTFVVKFIHRIGRFEDMAICAKDRTLAG